MPKRKKKDPFGIHRAHPGETHWASVLTDDLVMEIRKVKRAYPWYPLEPVANAMGVTPSTLWRAVSGQSWTHLPHPVKD